jgi:hypothetical protein
MNWNYLGWTVLVCLALLLPARLAGAACSGYPDTLTVLDERGLDTPIGFACENRWDNLDFYRVCSEDGSNQDLPVCPLLPLGLDEAVSPELLPTLELLRGFFGQEQEARCLDCEALRTAWTLKGLPLPRPSSCDGREAILFQPQVGQFAQAGDLACTYHNCGIPKVRSTALMAPGAPPLVKVAQGGTGSIGSHSFGVQASGPGCCEQSECSLRKGASFTVGETEIWTARPGERHIFPESGVAVAFSKTEELLYDTPNCFFEDEEGAISFTVFVSAPAGFQELTTEGEWCTEWCAAGEGEDVLTDSADDAQPDAVVTADPDPSRASSGSSCNLGPNPNSAPWPLPLLLGLLLVFRRARRKNAGT